MFAVIFATVSFSAMVGFLTSIFGQLLWLVVLVILATLLLRVSKEAVA
jgi:ascorbate-specific PTS system EIIC-type component UlaA